MMVMGQALTQRTGAVSANKTKSQSQAITVISYASNVNCHANTHIWSRKQYYTALLHHIQCYEHFELHVTLVHKMS
jgi:hypothetical protein